MPSTITISTVANSAPLTRLITSVRAVVRAGSEPQAIGLAVANLLQPYLGSDDLLLPEQCEPDPLNYRQHVLHVEPGGSFSVVSLVWLPGQATAIHDHVSWCVVGVHKGAEHETVYCANTGTEGSHLCVTGCHVNPHGSVAALIPPGDIHHVANDGLDLAVSIHIYGADIAALGSSIRRRYNLEVRGAL